jgi:hypothetical protein
MYDQLIYSNSLYEDRLEHTVNFSLGSPKGHSFGGSAGYSKVTSQQTSKIDSDNQYETTTIVMGASLKYTYAF